MGNISCLFRMRAYKYVMMNKPEFILDLQTEPDFQQASPWEPQSSGRHAALPKHIIMTLGQQVFALPPICCMPIGKAAFTIQYQFHVFCLPGLKIKPTTFHTLGKHTNHYTPKSHVCICTVLLVVCIYI